MSYILGHALVFGWRDSIFPSRPLNWWIFFVHYLHDTAILPASWLPSISESKLEFSSHSFVNTSKTRSFHRTGRFMRLEYLWKSINFSRLNYNSGPFFKTWTLSSPRLSCQLPNLHSLTCNESHETSAKSLRFINLIESTNQIRDHSWDAFLQEKLQNGISVQVLR